MADRNRWRANAVENCHKSSSFHGCDCDPDGEFLTITYPNSSKHKQINLPILHAPNSLNSYSKHFVRSVQFATELTWNFLMSQPSCPSMLEKKLFTFRMSAATFHSIVPSKEYSCRTFHVCDWRWTINLQLLLDLLLGTFCRKDCSSYTTWQIVAYLTDYLFYFHGRRHINYKNGLIGGIPVFRRGVQIDIIATSGCRAPLKASRYFLTIELFCVYLGQCECANSMYHWEIIADLK